MPNPGPRPRRSPVRRVAHLLLVLLAASASGFAQAPTGAMETGGGLMLTSRRLVIQGSRHADDVTLINDGAQPRSYRIKVSYRDMDERGTLVERELAKAGERPWQDLIRFSPRQVTLPAGQSQVIRVAVRKPADLPEGEYRYFLTVQMLPSPTAPASPPPAEAPDEIRGQIQVLYALSIPVIYRNGALHAAPGLSDLAFVPAAEGRPPSLRFRLTRSGNASIYGHLQVTFSPSAGGGSEEVGLVKGIAVYAELPHRWMNLDLVSAKGRPFKAGKLHLTFTPDGGRSPSPQADLDLP